MTPQSNLLTVAEAAKYLGITLGTLYVWRATKRHAIPSITLPGSGYVRYRLQDLEKFLDSRVRTPKEAPRRTRKRRAA